MMNSPTKNRELSPPPNRTRSENPRDVVDTRVELDEERGTAERAATKYEEKCVLLAPAALERLRRRRSERERRLFRPVKLGAMQLLELQKALDRTKGKGKREAAEVAFLRESKSIQRGLVKLAVLVAEGAVREFANGLLISQDRLGVNANWLREYTGSLVSEIRNRLGTSLVFRTVPLLPWGQDPIARKAILTCEQIIAERASVGDRWPYSSMESRRANPTWSHVVQEWEAFKSANDIEPGACERVPESFLRTLLSGHDGIEPEQVDWDQIRSAGADLYRHYGHVRMVPLELETAAPPRPEPHSIASGRFWKEREDEFRKHYTSSNCSLSAEWYSLDESWTFRSISGGGTQSGGPSQVFKPLAREAAKGLVGLPSDEPSLDWLDSLRRATDRSTGARLYSRTTSTGDFLIGEDHLDRMGKSGERIPPGGLIEFWVAPDPEFDAGLASQPGIPVDVRAEKRTIWETSTETIECLFESSALYCLELRSLSPPSAEKSASQELPGASACAQSFEPAQGITPGAMQRSASTPAPNESSGPSALANRETRKRRYGILKRYRIEKGLATMGDLARRAGASVTAIQGMVRGDRKRYAEDKLDAFLELLCIPRHDW